MRRHRIAAQDFTSRPVNSGAVRVTRKQPDDVCRSDQVEERLAVVGVPEARQSHIGYRGGRRLIVAPIETG